MGGGGGMNGENESLDDPDQYLANDTLLNAISSLRMIVPF